jgi:5S rRNA maturation endonuclease (ribonuclease M5)
MELASIPGGIPMTAQQLAERLGNGRKVGARYLVHCPVHDDHNPSLELKDGDKGVVMICRVGCNQDRVVDLVCTQAGITRADLFYEPQCTQDALHIVETYDYVDAQGTLRFQSVRSEPKAFRQRRPDGYGGWLWNLDNVELVLYRLSEVLEAVKAGRTIYIPEGEKDVETLRTLGLTGTCNAMGAGKWRDAYNVALQGAHVVLLPDNDTPGRNHAQQVAQALYGVAASIKLLELSGLPEKGDVSDWVAAGGTREQLEARVTATPTWTPSAPAKAGLTLTALCDLLREPEDTVEWVVEGLLPASGFSLLVAKPKVGKSTLARNLARAIAQGQDFLGRKTQQGVVIYLALEEKRSEVRKHFQSMGVTGEEKIYVHAASAPVDALQQLRMLAEEKKPVLIIIDPLFRFARVKDGNDYIQVTQALEPLLALARETRAHVLCVHHAAKGERDGGDSILGSTALFATVDTALFMKHTEQYRTIQSRQRYGEDLEEAVLHFETTTRTVTLGGSREQAEINRMQQAILACLEQQEQDQERGHALTEAKLSEEVEGKTAHKRTALRELVHAKDVERLGRGGKGDPYRYAVKNSRFRVPTLDGEHGNKHPKMTPDPHQSSSDACSQDSVNAAKHGNKDPDAGTSMHATEALMGSMPHNTCSHVPDISMEQGNKNPKTASDPRQYEENPCSQDFAHGNHRGNNHAAPGTRIDLTPMAASATPGWRVEV